MNHACKANAHGTKIRRWTTFTPPQRPAYAAHCGLVLHWRSYLLTVDRLWCIRKCDLCKKWFQAEQTNHRFCGPAHRKKSFEQRPDIRETRNAKRRKSDKEEQEENKRALRSVRKSVKPSKNSIWR
jgi:hypothetical protein